MKPIALLLTCEHGGNEVPREFAPLFASAKARQALTGHRGYDIGALDVARALARNFRVELLYSTTTRLLVEPNRSIGHRSLFSEFSKHLDAEARSALIDRYYAPHRERVSAAVESLLRQHAVVCHIGVHSFTPILHGQRRTADVGLLYDPGRRRERVFCAAWQRALGHADPGLRVRRNYPYRGNADGLTTALRRRFTGRYVGIELEINQALVGKAAPTRLRLAHTIAASLEDALKTRL